MKKKCPKKTTLTPKQSMFCKEYLIDQNATRAAKQVGYSEKTAYSIGQRLLKKVEIKKELEKLQKGRLQRVEITADYVLNNIKTIGERCMNKKKFKEIGALKAQELLGKHLKLFTDKLEVEVGDELKEALRNSNHENLKALLCKLK